MNVLARTARDLRRLWSADLGFTLGVAGAVLGVELFGRQSFYDLHDLLALFTLAVLALLVGVRHRRSPLAWVTALLAAGRRAGAWLRRGTFEIGLDLRGTPPVRRGTPPFILGLAAALAVWAAVAAWGAGDTPH